MDILFRRAEIKDAEILAGIYNESFYDDYIRFGECPGYGKTAEAMEKTIKSSDKYIILYNEMPIGTFSYKEINTNEYYIGCLCIIPKYQGKGIGTEAFQYILSLCKNWKKIYLETPIEKKENIMFYTKKCYMRLGNTRLDGNVKVAELYIERQISV